MLTVEIALLRERDAAGEFVSELQHYTLTRVEELPR